MAVSQLLCLRNWPGFLIVIMQCANLLDSSSLIFALKPITQPRYVAGLTFGTFMSSEKYMFGFGCVVMSSNVCLFSTNPHVNPSSSIACMHWLGALESVEKQTVSSAYVTLSKSAPGILCLLSFGSSLLCASSNITVITIGNRSGDRGHPCLIPVCCSCQSEELPSIYTLSVVFSLMFCLRQCCIYLCPSFA